MWVHICIVFKTYLWRHFLLLRGYKVILTSHHRHKKQLKSCMCYENTFLLWSKSSIYKTKKMQTKCKRYVYIEISNTIFELLESQCTVQNQVQRTLSCTYIPRSTHCDTPRATELIRRYLIEDLARNEAQRKFLGRNMKIVPGTEEQIHPEKCNGISLSLSLSLSLFLSYWYFNRPLERRPDFRRMQISRGTRRCEILIIIGILTFDEKWR